MPFTNNYFKVNGHPLRVFRSDRQRSANDHHVCELGGEFCLSFAVKSRRVLPRYMRQSSRPCKPRNLSGLKFPRLCVKNHDFNSVFHITKYIDLFCNIGIMKGHIGRSELALVWSGLTGDGWELPSEKCAYRELSIRVL